MKKLNIPQDWSDINLKKFRQIIELENKKDEIKIEDYICEFVEIMTGIDRKIIMDLDLDKLEKLTVNLNKFTTSQIPVTEEQFININGTLYIMDLNFPLLKFGQYIDAKTFPADSKNVWDYAEKICSVFLRPVSKTTNLIAKGKRLFKLKPNLKDYKISKYNAEEAQKNAEIFLEHLPMTYVYTIVCFFLIMMQNFANNLVDYTNLTEVQKLKKKKTQKMDIQKI